MTTEEQLKIAIVCLRTLSNKENVDRAALSFSRFGSAGAGMAFEDVRECAAEALAKMGIDS